MKKLQCLVPIMQAGLYNHLFELSGTRVISFYTSNWKLWICLHTASLSFTTSSGFTILPSKYGSYRNLWEIWEALSHKSHTLNCLVISYWKSHSKIWTLLETETIFLAGFAPIIADNACGSHFVIIWKLKKPNLKKMWPRYIFIQNYHMSRFQANT